MSIVINVYSTHRNPPALDFPHSLNVRRDTSDPEVAQHLQGFNGYVMAKSGGEMTATVYSVLRHLRRVQHHLSLEVEDEDYESFGSWAVAANALAFLPDGTVRDPQGRVLVNPQGAPDSDAEVPFPHDALVRRAATRQRLAGLGIKVPEQLPAVLGCDELDLRPLSEVLARAVALFAVAIRAESVAGGDPIPVDEIRQRLPSAFDALSPAESAFMDDASPDQQTLSQFTWRYEALFTLQWAVGISPDLPLPTSICDVPKVASGMLVDGAEATHDDAQLRDPAELLDSLDLHFRLHWAARQAMQGGSQPPGNLDAGVLQERRHALNWLTRCESGAWDEIDTPT